MSGPISDYADFIISETSKHAKSTGLKLTKISRNKLLAEVRYGAQILKYRILVYAISRAGRKDPNERRVEITSTYKGSLIKLSDREDVVIGIDRTAGLLVGLDGRRLNEGGDTHNASSFIYEPLFSRLGTQGYLSLQNTRQKLFTVEYQIYMTPAFLPNYLQQHSLLHAGNTFQASTKPVATSLVDEVESHTVSGSGQTLSYEQQVQLALKKMEVGRLGENIVFEGEKRRLTNKGKADLSEKVDWVSQKQPYLGYDIVSFNTSGGKEYLEVKSSIGTVSRFFISSNELAKARTYGHAYKIICVSNVYHLPHLRILQDPIDQIKKGIISIEMSTSVIQI